MGEIITVSEVESILRQHASLAPIVTCPLSKAAGRILREPLIADRDLPPFDRVMMDGYAIRATDAGRERFNIKGAAMAGAPRIELPDEPGAAVEVMTGAPLPGRADTIIPIEDTHIADGHLVITADVEKGQFIHRQGSDFTKGAVLVKQGSRFTQLEAGIAASIGMDTIKVSQRPRIAVFTTGDELIPVEDVPLPHQIRRSNSVVVEHSLASADFHVGTVGHLSDNIPEASNMLNQAISDNDVVIISGGISKGRLDWIPESLNKVAQCLFHGVAQRPGKPMGFWRSENGCSIFALPGNPVSTAVATVRHVIPFLDIQQGAPMAPPLKIRFASNYVSHKPLTAFLPVRTSESGQAMPVTLNNSADYARLAGTDGFVELDPTGSPFSNGCELPYYAWCR